MNEAQKVIEIALKEVGYIEKASNKDLESKTANAGRNNYTKYARDLDALGDFYNGKKNGHDWCDTFYDWCQFKAFGKERAMKLLNQPEKSAGAGCNSSANYYKKINQFFKTPKVGDQIFFSRNGEMYHTGLVYKVDNSKVYTIEGNTKPTNKVVANGGQVCLKSYPLNASYIGGYGRPLYSNSETKTEEKQQTTPSSNKTVLEWQKMMNKCYKCNLAEDDSFGPDSKAKANKHYLYLRSPMIYNEHVKFTQRRLIAKGYSCGKYKDNGYFGKDTEASVKAFQKAHGLVVDGYVGAKTTEMLLK